ncbi:hypothetical protein BATR1942_14950 [Bacillus atrophaeus 1942]|uniref:Uncharacterized protein n=1 Tax=Bacillus atrophaeus (strain 1942) TaxID=720555 RepID=A0ABN3ZHI2_BACA1|nr:hypothetical protein BATR1942_14950 [Bacillus atrophaeus 1942]AKL86396.1 hypothetical protein D068_cds35940 [Bacillus atrophaeus UCMB-5137]EIM10894.1 hypothetical protein UY9_09912 [Bacillus atrophaeus C89]KYD06279.1 hypothetical protein B4144_3575 [Bacillus atrophaeus]
MQTKAGTGQIMVLARAVGQKHEGAANASKTRGKHLSGVF